MTKQFLLMALLFLLPVSYVIADQQVVELPVNGMVCKFCVYGVKKQLKKLDGIQDVDVSLEKKRARIVMAPNQKADIDAIRDAITEAGFTPGEAKSITQ
jgi:mercuric ion binding protein